MLPIGTEAAEELQEMSSTLDTIDMSFPHLVEYDEEERLAAFIAASRLETGRSADGLQQVLFKMGIFKEGCLTWHHAHGGVVVNILIFGKKTWTVAPPGLPWFSAQQQKLEQNPGSVILLPAAWQHEVVTESGDRVNQNFQKHAISLSVIMWPKAARVTSCLALIQQQDALSARTFQRQHAVNSTRRRNFLQELLVEISKSSSEMHAIAEEIIRQEQKAEEQKRQKAEQRERRAALDQELGVRLPEHLQTGNARHHHDPSA